MLDKWALIECTPCSAHYALSQFSLGLEVTDRLINIQIRLLYRINL